MSNKPVYLILGNIAHASVEKMIIRQGFYDLYLIFDALHIVLKAGEPLQHSISSACWRLKWCVNSGGFLDFDLFLAHVMSRWERECKKVYPSYSDWIWSMRESVPELLWLDSWSIGRAQWYNVSLLYGATVCLYVCACVCVPACVHVHCKKKCTGSNQ